MNRKQQFETEEQTATARSKNRVAMKRKRQFKTEEQSATARSNLQSCDEKKASVQH